MSVYILWNPSHRRALIGTADMIAEERREIIRSGIGTVNILEAKLHNGLPPWMRNLEVIGMLEGDEATAHVLRREFTPETFEREQLGQFATVPIEDDWPRGAIRNPPWRVASPRFLDWLEANTSKWDGSEAEKLRVKGLGKRGAHRPVPAASIGLGGRVGRRRAEATK